MSGTPEKKFWDTASTAKLFADLPVPPYWEEFFRSFPSPSLVRVLDLGCGGGRNSELLVRLGFDMRACDAYRSMVDETRKRISSLSHNAKQQVVRADMRSLPYRNGEFDAVIANGVYHNAFTRKEFEGAVVETARVLRSAGSLCLNVFYRDYMPPSLKPTAEKDVYMTTEGLRMTLLSKEDLEQILTSSGFEIKSDSVFLYKSGVATGPRSVYRTILRRS